MSWLRITAINLIVFAFIFGILEIVARITLPEYVGAHFDDDTTWGKPISRHNTWGHRVSPDQVAAPLKRLGKEKRVLFIGDSVTFGYGVDYSDIYYEVAGRRLAESGCDAVLHGAASYNTNLEKLMNSGLRSFILDEFGADIIVYQFNPNDLDTVNPVKKGSNGPLTWRERLEKFRISYLNRSTLLKFIQSWSMRAYQQNHPAKLVDSLRYSPAPDPDAHAAAWKSFERSLVETNAEMRNRKIRFAILLIPESFQVSLSGLDNEVNADASGIASWPNDRVAELAARYGIPVFDSLQALREFRAHDSDTRLYFPNDQNHPNKEGHAVIGASVVHFMKDGLAVCSRQSAVP